MFGEGNAVCWAAASALVSAPIPFIGRFPSEIFSCGAAGVSTNYVPNELFRIIGVWVNSEDVRAREKYAVCDVGPMAPCHDDLLEVWDDGWVHVFQAASCFCCEVGR